MTGYEFCGGYWWVFPVVMIICCIFFMRKCSARRFCGFSEYHGPEESAMNILNKRYAKGDIEKGEYEEKKKILDTFHK